VRSEEAVCCCAAWVGVWESVSQSVSGAVSGWLVRWCSELVGALKMVCGFCGGGGACYRVIVAVG